jgi:ABC-type molybdate transport system permease subunit
MQKLNVIKFGIAFGLSWGCGMCFIALVSMFGWGTGLVNVLSSLYLGLAPSILGAILGLIWGFCDGFIGGWLMAWFYNKLIA